MQVIGTIKTEKPLRRIAVVALGWIFILGGIAGLLIPILPGGVLIFAGALILNPQNTWLGRALDKCRVRFPFLERTFRRFFAWGDSWPGRVRNSPGNS